MNRRIFLSICFCVSFALAQQQSEKVYLDPELTMEWFEQQINQEKPRIIFTAKVEDSFREKLNSDDLFRREYNDLRDFADQVLEMPVLEYKMKGRRLLSVSRDAVQRNLILAMIYRIEKDPVYLKRLIQEITAICSFTDWNPSHFLDAAEMALAVALPYDWVGEEFPVDIQQLVQKTLVSHAIKPGIKPSQSNIWWSKTNNWNMVCHGGLSIAAISIFEQEPELASFIINRAVNHIPFAFHSYEPDGAYEEGPGYWFYATNYLSLIITALETSFDSTFRLDANDAFRKSLVFTEVNAGPSGYYFNYGDASENGYRSSEHVGLHAWFARNFNTYYLTKQDYYPPIEKDDPERLAVFYLLEKAQVQYDHEVEKMPSHWLAEGKTPLGVFRSNDPNGLYLAAKGGSAADNHANMDAGSFILEYRGIRWSVDLGNQNYQQLESIIGVDQLWSRSQNSKRWELLTKNNFGHSTLTINQQKFRSNGRSLVVRRNMMASEPYFTLNLTEVIGPTVDSVWRTFKKINEAEIIVNDTVMINETTTSIIWQMITLADVKLTKNGAVLSQEGEKLELFIQSPDNYILNVKSLDPPPLEYDKVVQNLKRLEISLKEIPSLNNPVVFQVLFKGK